MQSQGFTLLGMALQPGPGLAAPDLVTSRAGVIEYLQALTLWLAGAVLIIAGVLLLISLFRFQRRPADNPAAEQGLPGNGPLEIIWTIIPMAILVVLIILTYQSLTGA